MRRVSTPSTIAAKRHNILVIEIVLTFPKLHNRLVINMQNPTVNLFFDAYETERSTGI